MTTLTQDIIAKLTGYRNSSYDRHRRDRTSWFAEHLAEWEVEDAIRVFAPRSVPKWDWDNAQDDFDAIVQRVVANPAFANAFVRKVSLPELIVKATRNTRKLGVYYGATGNIAIWRNHDRLKKSAFWSEERAHLVVLHELAHWAHKLLYPQGYIGRNKYAGSHGPLFKRVLAELWRQELGDQYADLLLANWDSYDQRVAPGLDWYKQDNPDWTPPKKVERSAKCSVPDRCGKDDSYCSECWHEHFDRTKERVVEGRRPLVFCVRYPEVCSNSVGWGEEHRGEYCRECKAELYPEKVLAVPASYNGIVSLACEEPDEPDLEVPIRPAEANELHSDPSGLAPTRYGLTRILEAGLKHSLTGSEPQPRPKSLFLYAAEQKKDERGAVKQVVLSVLVVVGLAFKVWKLWNVLPAFASVIAGLVVSGLSAITWEHIAWGGYVLGVVGAVCGLAVLGNKRKAVV